MLLGVIVRLFRRVFVRQLSVRFLIRMRDHPFFFRRRFLFFQFLFFVLFFRLGFSRLTVRARLGRVCRCIRRRESALLRVPRRQIVLRVGDMLGQRRHFFVGQVFMHLDLVHAYLTRG